jgi:predicted GIY-YIG superfamily endonuclease
MPFRAKRFVYVMRSEKTGSPYTGVTCDVPMRIAVHNSGGSRHTRRDRPWRLIVTLEFASEASALDFERYLKSGSGRAFAKRHFR